MPLRVAHGLLILLAVQLGCFDSRDPAQQAAERFLDLHYIEMNPQAALEITVGLAKAKVEDEIRLLAGQALPEVGARPRVHYRLKDRQAPDAGGRRSFVYLATISLDELQVEKRITLTVKSEGEHWRVANFQETD